MKTQNSWLFAIAIAVATLNAHAATLDGRIIWHITPNPNGSLYAPSYRGNMMTGIELGTSVGSGTTAFVPLTDQSVIRPVDITLTPYNLGGFQPEAGVVLKSQTKFRLADSSYRFESSDTSAAKPFGELAFSGNFSGNNYSITRIGVDFGPDNIYGTADDIRYTSGAGTIPVNAIIYRGVSNWFEERTVADTGTVERYLAGKQPFTITAEYSVANLGSVRSSLRVQTTATPAKPVISFFTASASSAVQGGTTLNWSVLNATTTVTLSGTGSVASSGNLTVTPSQTTTYTLVATGPGGTEQASVTVVVTTTPLRPAISFTTSASSVVQGGSAVLSWGVLNATTVTLSGTGSVAASGNLTVTPTKTGIFVYTIVATGPGGTEQASVTVAVTEPLLKPVITFNSNVGSVVQGGSATLTWNVKNETVSVNLSGTGTVAASGNLKVTPTRTTTYTITATGPGGTAEQSVTVVVTETPLRPTATFTASASIIKLDEVVTLVWDVTGEVTTVNLEGVGAMTKSGAYIIAPIATTTYTLTVVGPGGTVVEQVTVAVIQPPLKPKIASFTSNVSSITAGAGESAKLTWEILNTPTTVTLSGIGSVAASGSFTVTPTQTTVYTLVAIGPGGTVQQDVQVFVTTPPPSPTLTFTSDVSSVAPGKPAKLTWNSENAPTSVVFSDTGSVASSGSRIVTPTQTTAYTLTATGPGGSVRQTVTIGVTSPPQEQLKLRFDTAIYYQGNQGAPAEGTTITAQIITINDGTQGTGPVLGTWQVSTDGGVNWIDWLKDGFIQNLNPGESFQSTLPFKAGKPDGKTYQYRLKVSSSNPDRFANPTVFSDATAALRVVAGQVRVSIKRGNPLTLSVTAPPGTYDVQEATSVTGPWTFKEEVVVGAQGVEDRTYLTTGQGRFFRARAR